MDFQSISAADAAKFYWMRYGSDRATTVTVNDRKLKISKNDLFGVRELRGKKEDEVLLTTGDVFRLDISKSERLMDKAKEFRGKTPVIDKPTKTVTKPKTVKPTVKPAATITSPVVPKVVKPAAPMTRTQRYSKILRVADITKTTFAKALPMLKDDAERVDFKSWCVTQVLNNTGVGKIFAPSVGSALVRELRQTSVAGIHNTHPAIILPVKPKATITQLTPDDASDDEGPVKVRMSRLELPEIDDFTDHEIPEEFRQYTRSESKTGRVIRIKTK